MWFYYSILATLALIITAVTVDAILTAYFRRKKDKKD